MEKLVGQLVEFEVRSDLNIVDPNVLQERKEPGMRISIFNRIGFDTQFELKRLRHIAPWIASQFLGIVDSDGNGLNLNRF